MRRFTPGFLFLCFVVLLSSSAMAAPPICSNSAWYRVQLGAGVNQPVTKEEVATFIDTVFTERFPEGMTLIETANQWNCKKRGLIKERTTVVDIQCPDTEANFMKLREIAYMYIKQFVRAEATCVIRRIPGVNTFLYTQ